MAVLDVCEQWPLAVGPNWCRRTKWLPFSLSLV
jgi:hypothetical protein